MGITFAYFPSITNEARDANAVENKKLGLPEHRGSGPLAIVGGGNSINDHIEELKAWPGEIWAVNGTINWCLDHGIDAVFFTVDAQTAEVWPYDLSKVRRAALSIDCAPSMFAALKNAEVTTLPEPDGGPTSANSADLISQQAGYVGVTYFGCEGSFLDTTHAYKASAIEQWVIVKVGDDLFRTKPEFLEQSRIMAEVIRALPQFYSERSGGLLRAMVEHGMEYELMEVSDALAAKLQDRIAA